MKIVIFIIALVAVSLADDSSHPGDHKKRVMQKIPMNSIPNNGHQKPEYSNYQQQGSNYQQPSSNYQQSSSNYQQPSNNYQQSPVQQHALYVQQNYQHPESSPRQVNHQQTYNVAPQAAQTIIPVQFVPQPVIAPKFQLIAAKSQNGQMQLTLIPHNVFMNLIYGNHAYIPVQQPLTNHLQQPVPSHSPATSDVSSNYNSYVTTQPLAYAQSSNSLPVVTPPNYYTHQQTPFSYARNSAVSPSTALLYTHPSPQLYNNYLSSQSNSVYSSPSNQLNYYHGNAQPKYQFVYNSDLQHDQVSNYQVPSAGVEYEKSLATHSQALSSSLKTDHAVSPSEFAPQIDDTHFKPIQSYRTAGNYKN